MDNQINDLRLIKRDYGEDMAHLCRRLFPTILETPGALYKILSSTFAKYKGLYNDIVTAHKEYVFKEYIYDHYDHSTAETEMVSKTVREILDEAGYDFYECECFDKEDENDQRVSVKQFEKYYARGEELCSFRDPHRIHNHYIFFIVKKNVDEIKREDFKNPQREDLYSTSVLDLQFDRGKIQRVSIKSRYNHTVSNPDATYSNNLDRIADGLTEAFAREYGFHFDSSSTLGFELKNYIMGRDGKLYKYNIEIDNIHYCPNNVILNDGVLDDTYSNDKSRYIMMDQFVLDRQLKTFRNISNDGDSFDQIHKGITKTDVRKESGYTFVDLYMDNGSKAEIKLDSDGKIIGYTNNYITYIDDWFLFSNDSLEYINLPNLQVCGDYFLLSNNQLTKLNLPKLRECGNAFISSSRLINDVNMPSLEKCGFDFLVRNGGLEELSLPKLEKCSHSFLSWNHELRELSLPNLRECGDGFLYDNESIEKISLPNLEYCGKSFMRKNNKITTLSLPNLKGCSDGFMRYNRVISDLSLPQLITCGSEFLYSNLNLKAINLPKLESCGKLFLKNNESISEVSLPNLKICGEYFLDNCCNLEELSLPNLEKCDNFFLSFNTKMTKLFLPNLRICGPNFLFSNECLKELEISKLESCGFNFLFENNTLTELSLPNLVSCGDGFLFSNTVLEKIDLPVLTTCGKEFLENCNNIKEVNIPNINDETQFKRFNGGR